MAEKLTILGIAGSLRKDSYNRAALRVAQQLVPVDGVIEIFDLAPIPLFNQDQEKNPPQSVVDLKSVIRSSDAILFATPEYNYSVPGVLKNAIDWASRPFGDSAWKDKPVAMMGASPGELGSARAQYHLRQVLVSLNMHCLNMPEVMIAKASERFDSRGMLVDQKANDLIRQLLQGLLEWTRRLQSVPVSTT
ncbi:MAG TPA: NAD(P)H-dependent oxidoreductase [Terriglobia bacterium]|nr:NAD(P)H-dependent oxidoreductase [Terriglobia bacterium]